MFIKAYRYMDKLWQKTEIFMMVFILTSMTLVTFIYTMLNNLYMPFYKLADWIAGEEESKLEVFLFDAGDYMMDLASSFSWSNEFTKASFAWLIFFCMSYGVRVGGHIGVDALVKAFNTTAQRVAAYVGLGACLAYGGIMLYASIDWVLNFYNLGTMAEGLDRFGIMRWQITIIVPIGFILLIWRYLEIGYRIMTHEQNSLGLADETADALALEDIDAKNVKEKGAI